MNKFRLNNKKYRLILFIIILIQICYLYIILLFNIEFNTFINNKLNEKYNYSSLDIKDKLFNSSIIKSISYKNEIIVDYSVSPVSKNVEEKEKLSEPIVYIYNTHDTEKYSLPFVSDYSITPSVKHASYILKEKLNKLGISSTVENRSITKYLNKHNLNYYGCYTASRSYMKDELKKHDYKILIDLHRDSVKRKYTVLTYKNKKYAKILFVLAQKHKNYKKNEKFINFLIKYLDENYKGLCRGIMRRKDEVFNQDLSENAILIELGGVGNTIEELNNSLEAISYALNEYIKEKKYDR